MASVVKTLRINPKTEKELHEFIESRGGVKKALKWLLNEHKVNKRVDDIVERLKSEIDFTSAPSPATMIRPKETQSNSMAMNFIKM